MESIYQINENAVYETEIRALMDTDPVSATRMLNPLFEMMLNNTHAVKKEIDSLETQVKGITDETAQLIKRIEEIEEKMKSVDTSNVVKLYPYSGSLNDLTALGFYYLLENQVSDMPEGVNGYLIVIPIHAGSDSARQIFLRLGTMGTNDENLWHRNILLGVPGPWYKIKGSMV